MSGFNKPINTAIEIANNIHGDTVHAPFPFANSELDFFKRPLHEVEDEVAALLVSKGADDQVVDALVNQVLRHERRRQWRKRVRPFFVILWWRLTGLTRDSVLEKRSV